MPARFAIGADSWAPTPSTLRSHKIYTLSDLREAGLLRRYEAALRAARAALRAADRAASSLAGLEDLEAERAAETLQQAADRLVHRLEVARERKRQRIARGLRR